MPVTVTVDHAARRVLQVAIDPIALPTDIFAALDHQAGEGGWQYPTLSDFSRVRAVPTSAHMRAFLDHISHLSQHYGTRGPIAFVVPDNEALFGMFRMYSMLANNRLTTQVFKSETEAEVWLAKTVSQAQ